MPGPQRRRTRSLGLQHSSRGPRLGHTVSGMTLRMIAHTIRQDRIVVALQAPKACGVLHLVQRIR